MATTIPTSPRGHHPEPDRRRAPSPERPRPEIAADRLGRDPGDRQPDGQHGDGRVEQRAEVELRPGHREEERREDQAERADLVLQLVAGLGLSHDQAGDERPDDRGQADGGRDQRQGEHEDERRHERRVGEEREGEDLALQAAGSSRRGEPEPDEADACDRDEHGRAGQVAFRGPGHDADEDEREHVVDDGRAEDDPGEDLVQDAHVARARGS